MIEQGVPAELALFFTTMVMAGMIGWLRTMLLSAVVSFFFGFVYFAAMDGPVPDAVAPVEPDLQSMPLPENLAPPADASRGLWV